MSRRAQKYKERHAVAEDEGEDLEQAFEELTLKEKLSTIEASPKTALPPSDTLRLFQDCFKFLFESPQLETYVQTVKGDLYNRDYIKAFSDDDRRMAYCTRWTPSRSLAYASLFCTLFPIRDLIASQDSNVMAIGGGACAELVAFCSIFTQGQVENPNPYSTKLNINLIDIADWKMITNKVISQIQKKWVYQGPECVEMNFSHSDILKSDTASLKLRTLDLVTLMFTTNELFAEDRAGSLRFFQALNKECKGGALLLITESAGSYSHITIGTKKFPIQFLIDTILLGKDQKSGDWDLISQSDSCWYRCAADFDYPLKLENMRFFYRLYRKKPTDQDEEQEEQEENEDEEEEEAEEEEDDAQDEQQEA